ncbi:VPLPA-CTERM sorting domain-containing protein [Paracoccus sp. (in: a-proteobacteria)]|uniref:VPLPA-CTERM sorting domain-containing protein n=1 Tax=Paracoccus sp. TaxID=267 RepID=UPI0026DF6530|nr:VPLPA-CTERM sorting domain-containing protein [Paracoccus sp. (in: a-proteobacteria)]MDO5648417.1 VPLPA-CTERM sorting domain-containing protein [Paracoccus sp. (in: a-proteobacteria)]
MTRGHDLTGIFGEAGRNIIGESVRAEWIIDSATFENYRYTPPQVDSYAGGKPVFNDEIAQSSAAIPTHVWVGDAEFSTVVNLDRWSVNQDVYYDGGYYYHQSMYILRSAETSSTPTSRLFSGSGLYVWANTIFDNPFSLWDHVDLTAVLYARNSDGWFADYHYIGETHEVEEYDEATGEYHTRMDWTTLQTLTDTQFRYRVETLAVTVLNDAPQPAPVPLPAGGALLLAGLGAFAALRRRA